MFSVPVEIMGIVTLHSQQNFAILFLSCHQNRQIQLKTFFIIEAVMSFFRNHSTFNDNIHITIYVIFVNHGIGQFCKFSKQNEGTRSRNGQ